VLERVSALPGVRAAAFANSRPSTGGPWTDFELQGRQFGPGEEPTATVLAVSDDYFRALGIRVVKGRTFTDADRSSAPVAMVINEAMARRYWPGENVIGRQAVMKDWDEPLPGEVVGVVSDVRQDGLEAPAPPIVYYSQRQFGRGALAYYLLVKTEGDPLLLAGAVRAQVAEVDRSLPVSDLATMEQVLAASMASRRFNLVLIAVFAALALVLATIGVYGVMSYTVGLRRQEIAIRMALGAQRATVLKLVMGQAGRLVLAGALAGVLAALAFTRMMKSLLFGIGAADPATFAAVALLIGGVAMFASYLPARRAARVDPMRALHYE
jgi:putative ABC transport system permease protein